MTDFFTGPKVDIVSGSGMLCATVHPRPHGMAALVVLVGDAGFAWALYQSWTLTPLSVRAFWIVILVLPLLSLLYQFFGEEVIEFDSQRLTIRKGIHGWERKREYQIEECANLEWNPGRKGSSYLTCRAGRWPITFGNRMSESDANEIFSALQHTLPEVAQQICSAAGNREHFITLGLTK